MKYYSEQLKKLFDSVEECDKAEKEYEDKINAEKAKKEKLAEERKLRTEELDKAYKAALKANKKYRTLLEAFLKDYSSYQKKYSFTDGGDLAGICKFMFDL